MSDEEDSVTVHADQKKAHDELVGRTVDTAMADLLDDIDESLRRARAMFGAMMDDPKLWKYLGRTRFGDEIELFMEDEQANTELCWLWEGMDE